MKSSTTIHGLQFAIAYTLAKTTSNGTGFNPLRMTPAWNDGPDGTTQLHNLVLNYTWDIPNGSRQWNHVITRGLLDGWQLSGDSAFVSGDWSGVAQMTTTNNVDFTGGDGGNPAGGSPARRSAPAATAIRRRAGEAVT